MSELSSDGRIVRVPLGEGNSGPGGSLTSPGEMPLVIEMASLAVRVVDLRHDAITERRVEVILRRTGEPIISLTPGEARGLGYLLRRHGEEARDD